MSCHLHRSWIPPLSCVLVFVLILSGVGSRHDRSVGSVHYIYKRAPLMDEEKKTACPKTSAKVLRRIIGAGYNERYMAINRPNQDDLEQPTVSKDQPGYSEGRTDDILPFYVNPDYKRILNDGDPIDDVTIDGNPETGTHVVGRRSAGAGPTHWRCDSMIHWKDLGPDYFPRYVRVVKCTSGKCWFGFFECSPKAFTVKVLKRRTDSCVDVVGVSFVESSNKSRLFREEWILEEVAVTFCCECTIP